MTVQRVGGVHATVLICTYNRAARLGETLDSLAATRVGRDLSWDVLVVDNNSSDDTRAVVESRAAASPVAVRYFFEGRQGKSYALNTGLEQTAADIVVFTDDDVRVSPGWIEAACRPLIEDATIQYTGGPVRPIWEAPPPPWLSRTSGELWGTIAITDYGRERFVFEERRRIPLGANMAVRRDLIARIGGFRPDLGRTGHALMGQEQAEFFCRSRAAGARGLYVPEMEVQHHVPARRLTRQYFRRWWYGKGVSRARLESIHPITEVGLDLRHVPHIAGVPRYIYGAAVRHGAGWLRERLRGRAVATAREEMMLAYCLGYIAGRRGAAAPVGTPQPGTVAGARAGSPAVVRAARAPAARRLG